MSHVPPESLLVRDLVAVLMGLLPVIVALHGNTFLTDATVMGLGRDAEGVVSASERMRLTIPWAQVDGVREDDDNLYVDTRGQLSLGVVRSAFADAGAEQAFRDAIEAGRQGRWTDDQPTE